MARAKGSIGAVNYAVKVHAGHHDLIVDEGPELGGQDAGPAPYDTLLAALAGCTAITLRMYADRKQWKLEGLDVDLHFVRDGDQQRIDRTVTVRGDLTDDQKSRLADIAERTPVTLTLKSGLAILTQLR